MEGLVTWSSRTSVQRDFGQNWLRSKWFELQQVTSDIFKVYFIGFFEMFGDLQKVLNLNQHIRN